MKKGKFITYNILAFIAILNTAFIYFAGGLQVYTFTREYLTTIIQPLISITFIFITMLLVNSSYIATHVKSKKNLLRVSLLILVIMLALSIYGRIREILIGSFCLSCWLSTVLYMLLVLFNVLILRDLYKLVKKLFL